MERDLRTILAVQALRAFVYGFGSVLIGTILAGEGLGSTAIGVIFTSMLAGMAVSSIVVARIGDRLGRRNLYMGLLAIMGGAGTVFALTHQVGALIVAALTGTLSTDPNESGPITSLEQSMMGAAPLASRAKIFGRYNAVAYLTGSVGALAAGGPSFFRRYFPALPADQRWLLFFPAVAIICVLVAGRLSRDVETRAFAARGLGPSRVRVRGLAALFSLDAFAGGFVVQAFLVYWFHRRFGASAAQMGLVFFGAGLLQAGSSIAAGRLASRIGLLKTMVFTHLPSNLLLAAIPFSPVFGGAVTLLLLRSALSQMDVPSRQAYVVSMVEPAERTAAAAYTNTARYVTRPAGPVAAGALLHAALSAPFVVAGSLKVVYDLILFRSFRRVQLPND